MEQLRSGARNIIFGATGLVVLILFLRFVLDLFAADPNYGLSGFIYATTQVLVSPFTGIDWGIALTNFGVLNFATILIMAFYIGVGLLVSGVVLAFFNEDIRIIIMEVIDMIFKLVQFLLMLRIIFQLFGVFIGTASIVDSIFNSTNWVPLILPNLTIFNGVLDLSSMLILFIFLALDYGFEGFMKRWMEVQPTGISLPKVNLKAILPKPKSEVKVVKETVFVPSRATTQQITINVPAPVAAPQSTTTQVPG